MRVCYLTRADRGGRITGVRLFGAQTEGAWTAPDATDTGADAAIADAEAAAHWVAERLSAARPSRYLDLLCVDCDGGVCTWITVPSEDPAVVAAAFAQAGAGSLVPAGAESEGGGEAEPTVHALPPVSPRPRAVARRSRRPAGGEDEGERVAVIAMHDAAVRLFLDALDARGIAVGRVCSVWHALAEAWDPGAADGPPGVHTERVVASASPMSAIVLVEPGASRLVWVWSRAGEVVAGGSMRVPSHAPAGDAENGDIRLTAAELGRLGADWMAWSAQVGTVPSRVGCIGLPGQAGAAAESALVALAAGLRQAWPGAAVAAHAEADPVAATFLRLTQRARAESDVDPGRALPLLSRRPGRAHRSMHLWAAVALGLAAAALGVLAYRARAQAAKLHADAIQTRAKTRAAVEAFDPEIGRSELWMTELRQEVRRRLESRTRTAPTIPILAEVEGVSLVLSGFAGEGVELLELLVDSSIARVKVRARQPDQGALFKLADAMKEAILDMQTSLSWSESESTPKAGQDGREMDITYTGFARKSPEPGGG